MEKKMKGPNVLHFKGVLKWCLFSDLTRNRGIRGRNPRNTLGFLPCISLCIDTNVAGFLDAD